MSLLIAVIKVHALISQPSTEMEITTEKQETASYLANRIGDGS